MPESKVRQRLGMGQGAPEAGPDTREDDGPEVGPVSNDSPQPAPAERQSRSTWLGPEERERRMGRETTPAYPNSIAQGLAEAMPEALSPLQRLKRKVLEQAPLSPPESPVSPLRHMVDQSQDKPADPPTSGAGEDSPDQIAPDAVPASDPASALRSRISVDDAALVRGRERGHFRQGYFRDAVCFECNSSHQVNRSSKATACPQCGARIQLEDIDINSLHEKQIRTRGKVTVQRNGRLTRGPVECQDFVLQGALECDVVCSDQFQVRSDAELPARISCQRFVVDRKVRARALRPVAAAEAEILGTFEGKLACTGSVVVGPQGHVIGDVTASAIKLETGGVLEGGMTILAGTARDGKTDLSP